MFGVLLVLLTIACGCSSYRANDTFEAAERSLAEGNYAEAIDGYNKVISGFPGTPLAARSQYRIATVYNQMMRDRPRALEAYTTVRYMYPKSPEARLAAADMAGIYSLEGDHKKAIEEYQALLDAPPDQSLKYRRLIAGEYVKMNDFRQARIEYEELAASSDLPPELLPRILFDKAGTYYMAGESGKAIDAFDEVIRKYPSDPVALEARFGKGNALAEAGRVSEALAVMKGLKGEYPNEWVLEKRIEWLKNRLKEGPDEELGR